MTVPRPGAHGGDGRQVAAFLGIDPSAVLDLSASLNPVAPDVTRLLARHLDAARHYPDAAGPTADLARALGVDPARVLLTNGGAEAIALVASDLGRGWAEVDDFSLYRRHLAVVDDDAPRFRSDPHNPTGRLAGESETAAVWDEAFYPLATGRWTAARSAVTVGSLTKIFACPGLRLGYVIADPATIARLASRQAEWSVNGLAAAALPELLATADLPMWAIRIAALRSQLTDVLDRAGLDPQPSDANFVLCHNGVGWRDRLASQGVVVRDCASFGRPGQVRIAVPDADSLARLERALKQC